jgi:phosphatidylserine/phosphatidylglycerophosphate/cardiolipin synthase-like enzyme
MWLTNLINCVPRDVIKMRLLTILVFVLFGCKEETNRTYTSSTEGNCGTVLRIYFTNPALSTGAPEHPANVIAGYIDQTVHDLEVCAHELDSEVVTRAIVRAHRRGVRVRMVVETSYKDEPCIRRLQEEGIPIVDDGREGGLMHNKFLVFDGRAVWTGSMNFTENCTGRNDNHGIYIADERVAENYHTKFRWMFEGRKFGGKPDKNSRIPYPQVTLKDGTIVETYFAPDDHPAGKIVEQIRSASKSVHFLAFSFTHPGIADAILERASKGIEVQGVLERRQAIAGHSMYSKFLLGGPAVQVYLDGNKYNMHHKVIIVDGAVTIAGSFNFSIGADRDNDENVLIIHSAAVARQFESEFQRVLAQAR